MYLIPIWNTWGMIHRSVATICGPVARHRVSDGKSCQRPEATRSISSVDYYLSYQPGEVSFESGLESQRSPRVNIVIFYMLLNLELLERHTMPWLRMLHVRQ